MDNPVISVIHLYTLGRKKKCGYMKTIADCTMDIIVQKFVQMRINDKQIIVLEMCIRDSYHPVQFFPDFVL